MIWFDSKYYDPSYEWTDDDEDEWQASCDVRTLRNCEGDMAASTAANSLSR